VQRRAFDIQLLRKPVDRKAKDLVALARKIDFPSVRASLREAVVQKFAELRDRRGTLPSSTVRLAMVTSG
jgi:hypothetical protein